MFFELSLIGVGVAGLFIFWRFLQDITESFGIIMSQNRDFIIKMEMQRDVAVKKEIVKNISEKVIPKSFYKNKMRFNGAKPKDLLDLIIKYIQIKTEPLQDKWMLRSTLMRSNICRATSKEYDAALTELENRGLILIGKAPKLQDWKMRLTKKGELYNV